MFESVQKIHALPDDTRLFLCHDYPKQGAEPRCMVPVTESRNTNVHIHTGTGRDQFIALRRERDAHLDLPRLIFPALQINIRAGAAPGAEDNGVTYLRMPLNADIKSIIGGGRARS